MVIGFDQDGNYVWPDGTVTPGQIAEAAGFAAQAAPIADAQLPEAEQPVQAPLPPAFQGDLGQAHLNVPPPPLALGVPQAQPEVEAAQELPFDERVNRTFQSFGSYPGRQFARAEGIETGTDLGQVASQKTYEANDADALAEGTHFADAQVLHKDGAEAAAGAAREYDERIGKVRARSAQLREELDNFQLDPNRVFKKQGTFANIADVIAVAFGALAQFPAGQNVALQLIRKKVEDDMTAQDSRQKQLLNQYNRTPDEIDQLQSEYNNRVSQEAYERALRFKVIEDKLNEQLAASKGTRAEAGLAAALFEVNKWRMGELDKAERAAEHQEAQELQMRIAAMKAAGKGAGDPLAGRIKPVTGQFELYDPSAPDKPGEAYYPSIGELTQPNQDKFREQMSGAQKTLDHVGTLQEMDLSFKAYGEKKALAAQQASNLILAGFKALPGVETNEDALQIMKSQGLGNGTVDGLSQLLLRGGGDAVVVMLEETAQRAQIEAADFFNTVPRQDGRAVRWVGAQRRASKPVVGRLKELGKSDEERTAEKVAGLEKALRAGTAENPQDLQLDPKLKDTDLTKLRIATEDWLTTHPETDPKREQMERALILIKRRIELSDEKRTEGARKSRQHKAHSLLVK